MNKPNAVIFARSNSGEDAIHQQVERLRVFAAERGLTVMGTVRLPHCSANEFRVEEHVMALIARRDELRARGTILVTGLDRLTRDADRGLAILLRLDRAGWDILTPTGGSAPIKLDQFRYSGEKVKSLANAKQEEAHHLRREASHDPDGDGAVQGSSQRLPDGTDRTGVEKGEEQ